MIILAIDAALPRAGVAVVGADGSALARHYAPGRPGLIETLPGLIETAIAQAGVKVEAVAVTVGPGSFTGLRTAISLAQGYAAGAGIAVLGVSVAEAFAMAFPVLHRPLWVAVRARRDKIFLIRDGIPEGFADADIPFTRTPVAVAGDAANEVAARLAASGGDVLLTNARLIDPLWVAQAARGRHEAGLAPHPAQPVYVDPPEAKLPAGGLRPEPV
ncbi:MAG TPA: tRNA (adenosine(37)-N6)-threonylcarbamoyltransferase complex dimerization subunit type 1 TsaB [Acidocella sp.]|nr:tRNA (adenosine(37)-N6)-threonylcarbamoyltransferase complex dimerization subunit type 1 TsaB [Acidocella sp.]HQU03274.1 tRNA (adenosine(37)-N6)-threonylcarbamoyltransferase complex dimerization subunit type 1 TsaB [Acidocella sp.]